MQALYVMLVIYFVTKLFTPHWTNQVVHYKIKNHERHCDIGEGNFHHKSSYLVSHGVASVHVSHVEFRDAVTAAFTNVINNWTVRLRAIVTLV